MYIYRERERERLHTYRHQACYFRKSLPKYDENACSKLFPSQEQSNFRSCCPKGLRAVCSAKTARNLTTTPKGKNEETYLRGYGNILGSQ